MRVKTKHGLWHLLNVTFHMLNTHFMQWTKKRCGCHPLIMISLLTFLPLLSSVPLSTPSPTNTWLFSNKKNDFQILFKFATWPAPSSPPSPTLIPFPVSVCSFTAGADQVINEDIDGGSDVTTQFSGKWWWFALRRSEKSRFTFLQNLLDKPDTTWRNESNNNGSFRLSIASGRLSALTTMLMTLLTSIKLGLQLLEI